MRNGFTLIEACIVAAIIGIIAAIFVGPPYACKTQANLMGMRHNWSFFQGCMIEPKPGQWVPLNNYRVL